MVTATETPGAHGEESPRESSPYVELDRATWAMLASETESPLTSDEVARLRGIGDQLDLAEIRDVYLPLSRLLSLRVRAATALHHAQQEFLHGLTPPRTPFVIGLAGSVAVGKSTAARVLQQCSPAGPSTPTSPSSPPTASSIPTPSWSSGGSSSARASPSRTTARP